MDEATKQALNAFVQQMISAAQNGAQWTSEQAPIVVQEWLQWQLAQSAVLAAVLLVVGAVLLYYGKKFTFHDDWDDYVPMNIFALCAGLAVLTSGGGHALMAVKVYVAPRVVVLEKFMDLVK